ncbi:MAG: CopG family transcriptional regulator [Desulfobacteraceae bacterium]|nr:CopG family transcriptional regulator [Desulfobacteraceae bacterium]MBC2755832.1 CopG family transcriptional regulator [Desulfobacteraceae bacterium]
MGQVTIYLDHETEKKMVTMVKKSGLSKSKWIADLIKKKTYSSWPESIAKLAGKWKDMPTAEEIRKDMGADAKRESI